MALPRAVMARLPCQRTSLEAPEEGAGVKAEENGEPKDCRPRGREGDCVTLEAAAPRPAQHPGVSVYTGSLPAPALLGEQRLWSLRECCLSKATVMEWRASGTGIQAFGI